jgi:hypothetical protein
MLGNETLRCCFCGQLPEPHEYIELELHAEDSPATQFLGAHIQHLDMRLHPDFHVEIEPVGPDS